MSSKVKMGLSVCLLAMFLCTPFCGYGVFRFVQGVRWNRNVEGHIKHAADANSFDLAKQELTTVVKYLDENNIKEGYTAVLYNTPDTDVGFWYVNLKTSLDQLKAIPDGAGQGEKDMQLIKLRQTLLDHTEHGERVTQPYGIDVYPFNTLCFVIFWVTFFFGALGVILFFLGLVSAGILN